jgi:mannose-6-phosphate isomerase-like protein (cupin superfamily)
MRNSREQVAPYITRDGSEIRELMHPAEHGNHQQSLAEATVKPGCMTRLHKHQVSEELYHILSGTGQMTLGAKVFSVVPGDTICILPGMVHCIKNTEKQELVFLCCCSPPYSHEDTQLL